MNFGENVASTAVKPFQVTGVFPEISANSTGSLPVYGSVEIADGSTIGSTMSGAPWALKLALSGFILVTPVAYSSGGVAATAAPSRVALPEWQVSVNRDIDSLADFGGEGIGKAPSPWARVQAKKVVSALARFSRPIRIVPMADGGVGVVFPPVGARSARVDITNEEEVVVTLSNVDGRPHYREASIAEVGGVITGFLLRL